MTYLIIGASASLGIEIAKELSKDGYVYLLSRKDLTKKLKENIVMHVVSDYMAEDITSTLKDISEVKELTVIFMNALSDRKAFYLLSDEDIKNPIEVNVLLPLKLTRDILRERMERITKFVYLSSSRALKGDVGITMYSASKGALVSATKCLAMEYARFNKEFYVLSLGLLSSGLANTLKKETAEKIIENTAARKFVSTGDVLSAIRNIADNSYMNGSVVKVDYGYF